MPKPIITVFGATGAQGGGLARALLTDRDRHFAVRAVTRRPDGAAARELARAGAEIVLADLDDGASVLRALEGAYGAFFVTNFWEHLSAEKELAQAHTLAAAAAQAGIRHAIWSTLEDTRDFFPADGSRMPVLQKRFNVPHLDAKGEAHRYFAQQRVPVTYLYTSAYWENLIHFGMGPQRQADGSLAVTFPTGDARIPWIGVEDIGIAANEIFLRGDALIFDSIGVAGEHLSGTELARTARRRARRDRQLQLVTPDEFRALGFPGADELGNMWQFKRDFEARVPGAPRSEARAGLCTRHGELRHLARGEPSPHPGGAGRLTLVPRELLNWLLKLTLARRVSACGGARRRRARPAAAPRRYWAVRRGLTHAGEPRRTAVFAPVSRCGRMAPPSVAGSGCRRAPASTPSRPTRGSSRVGTKLWKEFAHGNRLETRYLERGADGNWRFGSYVWSADGKDAVLAPGKGMRDLPAPNAPGARYTIPSEDDCRACHEGAPVAGAGLQRAAVVARSRSAGAACRARRGRASIFVH